MEQKNKFEYTYSAPTERERKEAEAIRDSYQNEAEGDKLIRLKKLDDKVKNPPMIWSLCCGVVGLLIFGGGMAMVLEGAALGWLVGGIALSLVGLCPIAAAYPVYKYVLKKGKEKYRDEILKLSAEILNENKEE